MTVLAVSTLTDGSCPEWFDACRASVAAGLPAQAEHQIHAFMPGDELHVARWETTVAAGAKYIAWVDHDDLVVPGALQACIDALESTGAGVAFTYEGRIDAIGEVLKVREARVRRRDVAMHPQALHHLAVVRLECLSPTVFQAAQQVGIGLDWLMRAWCALRHGAVQVPMVGYYWRAHPGQESRTDAWKQRYAAAMPTLRSLLNPLVGHDAAFDQFLPG